MKTRHEKWRKTQKDIKAFEKIKRELSSLSEIMAVAMIQGITTY